MEFKFLRECDYCGETFGANRRDKKTCSKKCSMLLSNLVRKKYKIIKVKKESDDGINRLCGCCNRFLNKETEFNKNNDGYFGYCKECVKERRRLSLGGCEIEDEVGEFIMRIKSNNYDADIIDILTLTDLYDKIWPQSYLPGGIKAKSEDVCNDMFYKLAKWWKYKIDIKKRLEENGKQL